MAHPSEARLVRLISLAIGNPRKGRISRYSMPQACSCRGRCPDGMCRSNVCHGNTHNFLPNITLNDNLVLTLRILADTRASSEPLSKEFGGLFQIDAKCFQVVNACEGFPFSSSFSLDRYFCRLSRVNDQGRMPKISIRSEPNWMSRYAQLILTAFFFFSVSAFFSAFRSALSASASSFS